MTRMHYGVIGVILLGLFLLSPWHAVEHGSAADAASRTDSDLLLLPDFKLPYDSQNSTVFWTGGPHQYPNTDTLGVIPAGRGSGLDFASGSPFEVLAMASGLVIEATCSGYGGLGCVVGMKHDVGGSVLVYAHLDPTSVQPIIGQFQDASIWIPQGTVLGKAGNSGGQASIHLHVELRDGADGCSLDCLPGELGGNPLGWGDLVPFVDGYRIGNYLTDSEATHAYNYDGSAVKGDVDVVYGFPFLDQPGNFEKQAVVRVHQGFQCDPATTTCEDNDQSSLTQFAGHGLFSDPQDLARVSGALESSPLAGRLISTNEPQPFPLPHPFPSTDNAAFVADITIPDGTIVSPGQALHKVWRVRNSGTSTWESGYQLVFTGGDQMGAPSAVSVPGPISPGSTVDLAVDMTAPANDGFYAGHWRLRNAQGVFFGDGLWIEVQVGQASSMISLSFDPSSPSDAGHIYVTARAHDIPNLRAMRILVDGDVKSELGAPQVTFDWSAAEYLPGLHSVVAQAATWDDLAWAHPEQVGAVYELLPGAQPVNHAPYPPSLTDPPDYHVSDFGAPTLRAQENGDPDGDSITAYLFEIFDSPETPNSGWISEDHWTPPELGLFGYQWHAKVRDEHGAESPWSETRHFLIEDPGPQIYDFHWEWCRDAWGGPEKICFCADTNAGTLKIQVNSATDGSENGEWQQIIELGLPQFKCEQDSDLPPNWAQLEAESGNHLARLYALREGGWEAAATADIQIYLSPDRRPNSPSERYPPYNANVNSQTVNLDWIDTLRTTEYHLVAGTAPDPNQNPLLDIHLPASSSEYEFSFADDYATVYWEVTAIGPYGTNESTPRFHIDITPPVSAISALPPVATDIVFPVSWGGSDVRSGLRWYDIQFRDGERGEWIPWLNQTEMVGALFRSEPGHTYYFRSRAMDEVGNWEKFPLDDGDTSTLVDLAGASAEAWWNDAYALKSNIVVLNNDGHTMPSHYPVLLHFDDSTEPTAAELYEASQSAVKGDDFRITANDATELDRQVQTFSQTEIDIWFPLQTDLGGSQSSDGDYQLYYGNADAANPPADVNAIFVPVADADTMGLWHFYEGIGNIVHDTSGRNHDGAFASAQWTEEGKLGRAGVFDGTSSLVNFGHPADYDVSQVTLEGWINLTSHPGDHPGVLVKEGAYYLELDGRILYFTVHRASADGCGLLATVELPLNTWTHFAATYDGVKQRIYLNGQLNQSRDCPGSLAVNSADLIAGYISRPACLPGKLQHLRISDTSRTAFPYALMVEDPSLQIGVPFQRPGSETPDLAVQNLATYLAQSGETIVQAVVQNVGDAATTNGFYTDLYTDRAPTGPGDYTGSIRFWIASPIEAGATVTLTTVLADAAQLAQVGTASANTMDETTMTLYGQVDSSGVVTEPDETNNVSFGTDVCVASADPFEDDDIVASGQPIPLGETQAHNFDRPGDHDWVRFTAEEGQTYTLQTSNLGPMSDTYLYLYDTDGSTLLMANDDHAGSLASRMEWTAPTAGTYFLLARHWSPSIGGCGTSYEISVRLSAPGQSVYLPLVMSNHRPLTTVKVYGDEADGELGRINCDEWVECRDSSWGNFLLTGYTGGTVSASYRSPEYDVKRIFLFFDTSSLPSNAVIEDATLGVYAGPFQSGNTLIHAVRSTAGIPLSDGDMDEVLFQSGGSATLSPNAWVNIGLSAAAVDWIAKDGVTKLALIHDKDLRNSMPDGTNDALVSLAEDWDHRPYLILSYYVP